jgi:serine/threonine-protein kinase
VPAGWTADALGRIERDLARLVGPVARVLVHRGAQKHANAEDLRLALSTAISNEMERERFIQGEIGSGFGRSTQPGGLADGSTTPGALDGLTTGWGDLADGVPARSPATGAQAPVRADDPDRVTAVLVRQLGPIAKVIVKRAAANAMTRGQLVGATLKQCTAVQDLITLEAELWKVLNQGGEATA